MLFSRFVLFFFALSISSAAFAQPQKLLADKIIGIVGNKIVLKSDVDNSLSDMQRQGISLPENAECYALEQAMNIKALVLQADKDSLPVTDEEVETDLDNRIRHYIEIYGNKSELERVAGKTIYQIKEDQRTAVKDQKMALAMRNKIVDGIRITPDEVKRYFEKLPADSLPYYESEVEIGQIVVYPKPSREAEEYAQEQLQEYKKLIEGGRDFKTLANLYSDDPSAKQNGGQFEISRGDNQYDRTWLGKAFTLKEGQVSNPFKTQFGYHIMQLVSRAGDDAVVRHILKIPQVTSIETAGGLKKMDSVRAQLIAGTIDFGTAVSKYSEDPGAKFSAGMMQSQTGSTFLTIDQLDKNIIPALQTLTIGEFSQPIEFTDERGKKGVKLIYLRSQTAPHRENLKDDYAKIADKALEEKKDNALEKWFGEKLDTYYIKVDPAYSGCEVMDKWVTAEKHSKSL